MPTISAAVIPFPKSWDEFEEITRDSLKLKWNSPNLQRIGRQGQSQQGVDIYGEDDLGRSVGVQCKLTENEIDLNTIQTEIQKANCFVPSLEAYYIATTSPQDAKIQRELRVLSKARLQKGEFPIGIIFWNDIVQELLNDEKVFHKHYPQMSLTNNVEMIKENRLISLYDAAYLGIYIDETLGWLFGSFSTPEGPKEFKRLIFDLDSIFQVIFKGEKQVELRNKLKELIDYVLPYVLGNEERPNGWSPAKELAEYIQSHIQSLEYSLIGKEFSSFKLGQYLGAWTNREANSLEKLSKETEQIILKLISSLTLGEQPPRQIVDLFDEYRASESISVIHFPHRIYNKVRVIMMFNDQN